MSKADRPAKRRLTDSEDMRFLALLMLSIGAVNTFVLSENAPVGRIGIVCALLVLADPFITGESRTIFRIFRRAAVAVGVTALVGLAAYGWARHDQAASHLARLIEDGVFAASVPFAYYLPRRARRQTAPVAPEAAPATAHSQSDTGEQA